MGYKLAGFEVIGANDIDPEMAEVYRANHKPKHYRLQSIIDLVNDLRGNGIPEYLCDLDLLDGSPPCSSFSISGLRDKTWGTLKKFREGQATQRLDDLFFSFLDLVDLIRPRVFVAENVPGILIGKAKGYAKAIVQKAKSYGYSVQVFKVDATSCGVPQTRVRIFFVGTRENNPKLVFLPSRPVVSIDTACRDCDNDTVDLKAAQLSYKSDTFKYWNAVKPGQYLSEAHPKKQFFTSKRNRGCDPIATIVAYYGGQLHGSEPRRFTWKELLRLGSFPDDYKLCEKKRQSWNRKACYLVGMSVPPFMVRSLSTAIYKQWLA